MKTAIKWGAILGVTICVWTLVIHYLGFYTTNIAAGQKADIVVMIVPIATITLALRERRRQLARGLPLKESLGIGVVAGLVSVPITAGFLWWYHHFLNPKWMDYLVEYQRAKMTAAGLSADLIATAEAAQRASGGDAAQLVGAVIGTTILTLLISLIAGAFLRGAPKQA